MIFWTGAWLNMLLALGLACLGVQNARRGRYDVHRRMMLTASGLVLLFIAAYLLKLAFLGREQLELWEVSYVWVLRFHELCVFTMIAAGATAVTLAVRLGLSEGPQRGPDDPRADRIRLHRRAGMTAIVACLLGAVTSAYVLLGMYARL